MSDEKKPDPGPNGDELAKRPPVPMDLAGLFYSAGDVPACSFDTRTPEGRQMLQKCEEDPDTPVRELINKRINLKHLYARRVEIINKETGEVQPALRICLVDADGSVHGCASVGVADAIRRFFSTGRVPPFNPPIPVEVRVKGLSNGRQRLTLLEVFDKPKGGAK